MLDEITALSAHTIFGKYATDETPIDDEMIINQTVEVGLEALGDVDRAAFERGGGMSAVYAHISDKTKPPYDALGLQIEMIDHVRHWKGEKYRAQSSDIDTTSPMFFLFKAYALRSWASGAMLRTIITGRSL